MRAWLGLGAFILVSILIIGGTALTFFKYAKQNAYQDFWTSGLIIHMTEVEEYLAPRCRFIIETNEGLTLEFDEIYSCRRQLIERGWVCDVVLHRWKDGRVRVWGLTKCRKETR